MFVVGARNGSVWGFFVFEGFVFWVFLGGDGRKKLKTINDQSLE